MLEYQYVVSFSCRQQLNDTFRQMKLFEHPSFRFPLMRRSNYKSPSFNLSAKFVKLPYHIYLLDFLDGHQMPLLNWASLLRDVLALLVALHNKGLSLGLPIETLFFINVRQEAEVKAICYYFQSFSALRFQCLLNNP
jgi:hypothetical protein